MPFDYTSRDAQSTPVEPVRPENFDVDAYAAYESSLLDSCRAFWQNLSGVAVYRRFRPAEVFADGCRDMKRSLELQLGALQTSMEYPADVPNFLEPWYGIGTAASAFGMEYIWKENLAPAMKPAFASVPEALGYKTLIPVRETTIGKYTLHTIEYFLEETGGKLPMSLCDVQSPLNTASYIVDINQFLVDCMISPDQVKDFMIKVADLIIEFTHEQLKLIGDNIVWPGHGFASSRVFRGFGASDDNILMMDDEGYRALALPALIRLAEHVGGPVFHSCGNWTSRRDLVTGIPGLKMADGAFTHQTDPSPNSPEIIGEAFAGTGIALCARMVGEPDIIADTIQKLWRPGLKLIAVTYCQTPEEQQKAYDLIHHHCA